MGPKFQVVVADDDPDVLALHMSVLERGGYEVVRAESGRECLAVVKRCHPALVLLDVILPDMNGMDVCREIKNSPELGETFVILTSGIRVSSDWQADGLNTGADGYIVKPISNRELLARVQAMERIKQAEDALRQKKKEQEELIAELKAALAEIRTLKGLIPICFSCKKIRDDKGFWNQLESYISEHTDAVFSHGLCPDCAEKLRSELMKVDKKS